MQRIFCTQTTFELHNSKKVEFFLMKSFRWKKVSSLTWCRNNFFSRKIQFLIKFLLFKIECFFQPPTQIMLLKNTVNKFAKAIIIEKSFFILILILILILIFHGYKWIIYIWNPKPLVWQNFISLFLWNPNFKYP